MYIDTGLIVPSDSGFNNKFKFQNFQNITQKMRNLKKGVCFKSARSRT